MSWVKRKEGLKGLDRVSAGFFLAYYRVQNRILSEVRRALFQKSIPANPKRILLLRQGGLGDTMTAMPSILALKERFAGATIDLLTHERLPGSICPEELLPADTFGAIYHYSDFLEKPLVRQLKENNYDLFIELPSYRASLFFELRSMLLARWLGIKNAMGWQVSCTYLFAQKQERLLEFDPDRERLFKVVTRYGLADASAKEKYQAKAASFLKKFSFDRRDLSGSKMITLLIGAGCKQNRWPLERYRELADYYSDKGYMVVLIGNETEHEEAKKYTWHSSVVNLCGALSPHEAAALMKECSLVIGNDTGPMHLAYTMGTDVVALFSARDYSDQWFPPANGRNVVLRNGDVPCAICMTDSCADNVCMKSIKLEQVTNAADNLLSTDTPA